MSNFLDPFSPLELRVMRICSWTFSNSGNVRDQMNHVSDLVDEISVLSDVYSFAVLEYPFGDRDLDGETYVYTAKYALRRAIWEFLAECSTCDGVLDVSTDFKVVCQRALFHANGLTYISPDLFN